jgi:hypothetical protein
MRLDYVYTSKYSVSSHLSNLLCRDKKEVSQFEIDEEYTIHRIIYVDTSTARLVRQMQIIDLT